MLGRSDVPHLPIGELAVHPQQGHKSGELEPARIQLPPLLEVLRFDIALKTRLDRKAADIHGPPGHPGEIEIKAGRNLGLEIEPARDDIATPGGCGVALLARKDRPGEDENPLAGIGLALVFIDAPGMDQGIAVEVAGRGAQPGRADAPPRLLQREVAVNIGLGRIQPPGVKPLAEEVLVDLVPVELARLVAVGIVEGAGVPRADPVALLEEHIAGIEPSPCIELVVMAGADVELGPD